MSTSILILLVVQIILIILNAIFASAEIAVLSMNETKLERMAEQGNGRAKRLVRLTQEPARFLATIQVAITLSGRIGDVFPICGKIFPDLPVFHVLKLCAANCVEPVYGDWKTEKGYFPVPDAPDSLFAAADCDSATVYRH